MKKLKPRTKYDNIPLIPHKNSGEYLVETIGVKTVQQEVQELMLAGQRLDVIKKDMYQYVGNVVKPEIHPLTDLGMNELDATELVKKMLMTYDKRRERHGLSEKERIELLKVQKENIEKQLNDLGFSTKPAEPTNE